MGKVEDESDVKSVKVNGTIADLSADGQFWLTLELNYGNNQISIEAEDIHGNKRLKAFEIDRQIADSAAANLDLAKHSTKWSSPSKFGFISRIDDFVISGCLKTQDSAQEVNVYVNGQVVKTLIAEEVIRIYNCENSFEVPIKLQLDNNKIRVQFVTNKGTFEDQTEVIYCAEIGKYYALIIGV